MKRLIYTLICLSLSHVLSAQQALRTAYFLDGYNYAHQINPAKAPERSYFSLPALGNLNVSTQANYGVSNLLFTQEGSQKLVTGLHESVSASDFLGPLPSKMKLNASINETLFSTAFRAGRGYNFVELNLRTDLGLVLPTELFTLMIRGMSSAETTYDLSATALQAQSYAELALGHQHNITNKISIGLKAKILVGLAMADLRFNQMDVTLSREAWTVSADGELTASNLISLPADEEGKIDFDNIDITDDIAGAIPPGLGAAFDLGITFRPIKSLEVSAAVTDLGFIKWRNATNAKTQANTFRWNGFTNVSLSESSGTDDSIDDQWSDLSEDLEELYALYPTNESNTLTKMLGATVTVGALYTLPVYKGRVKVGALSTTRINGAYTWTEGRLSANWLPCRVFDASVSYAASTFGHSLGWVVNLHPRGFNLFVGSDMMITKVTQQYIPLGNANTSLSLGINFPI